QCGAVRRRGGTCVRGGDPRAEDRQALVGGGQPRVESLSAVGRSRRAEHRDRGGCRESQVSGEREREVPPGSAGLEGALRGLMTRATEISNLAVRLVLIGGALLATIIFFDTA